MKECSQCKRIFADDLFFCLFDGTPLPAPHKAADRSAATEVLRSAVISQPTEVVPKSSLADPKPSKLPYIVIAVLALVCVGLGGLVLVNNVDRFLPSRETQSKKEEYVTISPGSPAPTSRENTPMTANSALATTPPPRTLIASGKWTGDWSTGTGALLDFELSLSDTGNEGISGQIKWTLRHTTRPDKMDKVGLSAIEFVRGRFDPVTGDLRLSGYGKDDPNNVLVMVDEYKLTVSADNRTLTGLARNGGKWNGHVRLSRS
jgi:hypothetical protein